MRILVVDDHPLMADALRLALTTLERRAEVQTAPDLESALRMASATPEFDLVMLDLGLPGCSGVQALERFRELFPALPVVVISGSNEIGNISAALEIGAMGYIPKSYPRNVLLNAVRLVVSGGIYVPVEALKARGEEASADATSRPAAPGRTMLSELGLSPRQTEVLSLLLKGLPNKLIARKLDISENTTKIHVSAVLHALGVSTRTQALIAANRLGLRLDGA
jgi:DNA-binding NarL/FixJ family response regulator